jgi:hypothetical protein
MPDDRPQVQQYPPIAISERQPLPLGENLWEPTGDRVIDIQREEIWTRFNQYAQIELDQLNATMYNDLAPVAAGLAEKDPELLRRHALGDFNIRAGFAFGYVENAHSIPNYEARLQKFAGALSAEISTITSDNPGVGNFINFEVQARLLEWKSAAGKRARALQNRNLESQITVSSESPEQQPLQCCEPSQGLNPSPRINSCLIKDWMTEEGYTVPELALRLRVSKRAITSILNQDRYHGNPAVTKLAREMNREIADLYEG